MVHPASHVHTLSSSYVRGNTLLPVFPTAATFILQFLCLQALSRAFWISVVSVLAFVLGVCVAAACKKAEDLNAFKGSVKASSEFAYVENHIITSAVIPHTFTIRLSPAQWRRLRLQSIYYGHGAFNHVSNQTCIGKGSSCTFTIKL